MLLHSSLIVFNCTGWIWRKTRKANLVLLLTTAGSWLILGLLVGSLGYCPLTDWHFRVLTKLGVGDLPVSYVKYLADRILGTDIDAALIDALTLWTLVAALILSMGLNYLDYRRERLNRRIINS